MLEQNEPWGLTGEVTSCERRVLLAATSSRCTEPRSKLVRVICCMIRDSNWQRSSAWSCGEFVLARWGNKQEGGEMSYLLLQDSLYQAWVLHDCLSRPSPRVIIDDVLRDVVRDMLRIRDAVRGMLAIRELYAFCRWSAVL